MMVWGVRKVGVMGVGWVMVEDGEVLAGLRR